MLAIIANTTIEKLRTKNTWQITDLTGIFYCYIYYYPIYLWCIMHFQEHFSSPQNSIRLYMAPFSKKPFSYSYQKTLEKSGVHNISKQFKGKIHAKNL